MMALIEIEASESLRTELRRDRTEPKFELFKIVLRGSIEGFLQESVDNCALLMEAMTASPFLSIGQDSLKVCFCPPSRFSLWELIFNGQFVMNPESSGNPSLTLSFHTCFATADFVYDKWARRAVALPRFGAREQTFTEWFRDQLEAGIGCFNQV